MKIAKMSLCTNVHEFTHNNMERDEDDGSIYHGYGEMSLGENEPQEPPVFVIFKQFLRNTKKILVYLTWQW